MSDIKVTARRKLARHVSIATPSRNDMFTGEYVRSVFRLVNGSRTGNTTYALIKVSNADVEHARNLLVSNFYFNQPNATHILFIDDDMGFEPDLIERMLDLDEDVVGAICHKRSLNLERLHALGAVPFQQAYAQSLEFIGQPKARAERRNGFVTVNACGAGILLISRAAIAKMVERVPELVRPSRVQGLPQFLHPFDRIRTETELISEDISFCRRWTEDCQGKIWASTASPISHVGSITLLAKYDDLTVA